MSELITENYEWSTLLRAELVYASLYVAFLTFSLWYRDVAGLPIYPGDILDIIHGLANMRDLLSEIRDNLERLTENLAGCNPTAGQIDMLNFMARKVNENEAVFNQLILRVDYARIWGMYENELRQFRDELPELITHISTLIDNLT